MDLRLLLFLFSLALAEEDIADVNGVDRNPWEDDLGPVFPFEAFGIGYEDFLKKVHPPMLSAMNYRPVMPYDIPQMEPQSVLPSVATLVATAGMDAKSEQQVAQMEEEWEEIVAISSEELEAGVTGMDSPSTRYYEEKSKGYEANIGTEEAVVEGVNSGQESSAVKAGTTEEFSPNDPTTSSGSTPKTSGLKENSDATKASSTDKKESLDDTSSKDETNSSVKSSMTAKSDSSVKSQKTDPISVVSDGRKAPDDSVLSQVPHPSHEKARYFAESEVVTKAGSSSTREEETSETESSEFEMASTDYYSDEYFYYFPGYMYADSSESDSSFSSEESESSNSSFESESFSTETQIKPNKEFLADKVEIIKSFDISYRDSFEASEGSQGTKSSGDSNSSLKRASKSSRDASGSKSSPSRSVSSESSLSSKSKSEKSLFSATGEAAVSTSFSMGKHVGASSDSDIKSTTVSDSKQSRSRMEKEKSISEREKSQNQKLKLEDLKKIVEESYSELARLRKKLFKKENVLNELNQVIDDLQKMCDKICRTVPPQYMIED